MKVVLHLTVINIIFHQRIILGIPGIICWKGGGGGGCIFANTKKIVGLILTNTYI